MSSPSLTTLLLRTRYNPFICVQCILLKSTLCYKFIYPGFLVLYCSMDICEEKFLAYFWWCYDRLKVILCLCCFLRLNSSTNFCSYNAIGKTDYFLIIREVSNYRMTFDSKIKQEAFCSKLLARACQKS